MKNMSPEARKSLTCSQMAEAAQELLRVTTLLAENLRIGSALLVSDSPLAVAKITYGPVTIEFLYGPAEFNVEMVLCHKHYSGLRLGLAELFSLPKIKDWAMEKIMKEKKSIESEVNWYGDLLLGPCSEVLSDPESFFNRFQNENQKA